jgi:YfiH family protein
VTDDRAEVLAVGQGMVAVRRTELIEVPVPGSPVPRAELDEWRERFGLVAGITERGGGEPFFGLGLTASRDASALVMERFRAFRAALRPAFTALQMAHQVHGRDALWHQEVAPGWHVRDDADAHATAQRGLLLAVTVADCVPVYLAARDGRAIALVHAGWKGVAGGVLESAMDLLRRVGGVLAEDLVVHCGVAICGDCYQVGPEVVRAVEGRVVRGRTMLDLREALARRAEGAGVREISISPLCTSCDAGRFFSHRASGGDGGRQIAYLGRPAS